MPGSFFFVFFRSWCDGPQRLVQWREGARRGPHARMQIPAPPTALFPR